MKVTKKKPARLPIHTNPRHKNKKRENINTLHHNPLSFPGPRVKLFRNSYLISPNKQTCIKKHL